MSLLLSSLDEDRIIFREEMKRNQNRKTLSLRNNWKWRINEKTNSEIENTIYKSFAVFKDSISQIVLSANDEINDKIVQNLHNDYYQINSILNLTSRINKGTVFSLDLRNLIENLPQQLELFSDIPRFNLNESDVVFGNSVFQNISTSSHNSAIRLRLLKSRNRIKYNFYSELGIRSDRLKQNLSAVNNADSEDALSNLSHLSNSNLSLGSNLVFRKGKFQYNNTFELKYQNFSLTENINDSYIYPKIAGAFAYAVNRNSNFVFNYFYDISFPSINEVFNSYLFNDFRYLQLGSDEFFSQRIFILDLLYYYENKVSFWEFKANTLYKVNSRDFYQDLILDEFFQVARILPGPSTDAVEADLLFAKFFPYISSRFGLELSANRIKLFNALNDNILRENILTALKYKFTVGTSFQMPVNFFGDFQIRTDTYETEIIADTQSFQGMNSFYQTSLVIKGDTPPFYFSFKYQHHWLLGNDFNIVSTNLVYKPEGKKYELALTGKNLTNNRFFNQFQQDDISFRGLQFGLLPRMILLGFNLSF